MESDQARFRLPGSAHNGGLTLRVADLATSVDFYNRLVGFHVQRQAEGIAELHGAAEYETVVRLVASPDAPQRLPKSAGLFHAAFRYPGRRDLAAAVRRFVRNRYPLDGAADHLVSDAIYLRDPDGNGVELYTDRPRGEWPRRGDEIAMSTEPLDVDALLTEETGATASELGHVDLGHVHLQVTDIPRSERFYSGLLGFDVTQRSFPGALFLSAGGYHHHIGMNIWSSRRGTASDPAALGLVQFTVNTGDDRAVEMVRLRLETANVPVEIQGEGQRNRVLLIRDPDNIGVAITA